MNISRMSQDIRIGKTDILTFDRELWSANYKVGTCEFGPNPNGLFRVSIFQPLGDAGPSNFNMH